MLVLSASAGAAQNEAARAKQAYARAIDLEGRGNDAAALPLLWQAGGLAPRDPDVQNRLGEALARLGALDAATEAFRRAIAERPRFHKAANNLVLALVQSGRGPEALAQARQLLAAAPDDPDRHFTLGLAQSEQDLDGAIITLRRVLALDPRHVLARHNLALVLQRADRLTEAAEQLTRAIAIEPRPEAHYALGVIHWHQGDLARAVKALNAAIEADPKYVRAYDSLGAVLKDRRDWGGATAALRRAIALRPESPGAYITLARVLQLAGDKAGARWQLAEGERLRVKAEKEREALVWTTVGSGKMDSGNLAGALDDFRRATTVYEPYAPAHYQLGRVLQRLGESEAARVAFARAQQLNPALIPAPYNP